MKTIKLNRATTIGDGKCANAGDIVEVNEDVAFTLIQMGKAKESQPGTVNRAVSAVSGSVQKLTGRPSAKSRVR